MQKDLKIELNRHQVGKDVWTFVLHLRKRNPNLVGGWLECCHTFVPKFAPIRVMLCRICAGAPPYSVLGRTWDARKVLNVIEKQTCPCKFFRLVLIVADPPGHPLTMDFKWRTGRFNLHEPHCIVCHW